MSHKRKIVFIYARVSTDYQHLDAQQGYLTKYYNDHRDENIEKLEEVASGRKMTGRLLQHMKQEVAAGNVAKVVVYAFDRLGRNVIEGLRFVELCNRQGVEIVSHCEPFDVRTPEGRMFFTILMTHAEYHLGKLSRNTSAGLRAAKARGTFKGGSKAGFYNRNTLKHAKKIKELTNK